MKIQVRQNKAGDWYWRLVARNGKIPATAGESFANKSSAIRAAIRMQGSMVDDPEVVVFDDAG